MSAELVAAVDDVLSKAEELVPDDCRDIIRVARERLHGPLHVAIVGKVKAGKSTLLNAIVGERVAGTDASECTKVVTSYRNGPYYAVHAVTVGGDRVKLPHRRETDQLTFDLGGLAADDVAYVDVEWPSTRLDDLVLIDTPGLASATFSPSQRTERFLRTDEGKVEADAVIYLMRHLHPMDMSFLEAFADGMAERWASVNSIAVLSRADEIGAARVNAMHHARRVAERYRQDQRIRAVAQVVTPVAGLVAQAAPSLGQRSAELIAEVARQPDGGTGILTSARAFHECDALSSSPDDRAALLDEIGLYGVRYGANLFSHDPSAGPRELAGAFEVESGISELRSLLAGRFYGRAKVLQARSALSTVGVLAEQCDADTARRLHEAVRDVERSAHELVEIQTLSAIAAGEHGLGSDAEEAERLLGGAGAGAFERLALPRDVSTDKIRTTALAAVQRWRSIAQDSLIGRRDREIAGAVLRTCEGLAYASDSSRRR